MVFSTSPSEIQFSLCEWVKTKWFLLSPKLFEVDVNFYLSALCELFDKADTGGDGTISIPEYIAMCDEYGIEINDEHINSVKAIANENGEVNTKIITYSNS